MMLIFRRRNTNDKYVAIRASAILTAHDLPEGGGCEVTYTTTAGEVMVAQIAESATEVAVEVNEVGRNT